MPPASSSSREGSSSQDAPPKASSLSPSPSLTDGSRDDSSSQRGQKRHADDDAEPKERKLTKQGEMQIKLLASLPSMNGPLRDARGRRRSTCVSSEEIIEAGLSALVGGSAQIGGSKLAVADHTNVDKEEEKQEEEEEEDGAAPARTDDSSDSGE